jgi:hypothetical protein
MSAIQSSGNNSVRKTLWSAGAASFRPTSAYAKQLHRFKRQSAIADIHRMHGAGTCTLECDIVNLRACRHRRLVCLGHES